MSFRAKLKRAKEALVGLKEADVAADPLEQFQRWFDEAVGAGLALPESMIVATASRDGRPSARTMLLKGVTERGFRFFTNYESRKGKELDENPRVALVFHWAELARQVRVEGVLERISEAESTEYFHSRPRGSQLGAWASRQSNRLANRQELEQAYADLRKVFKGREVPLPPYWGGYVVRPERIEFWQGRADRLHDRLCYTRVGGGWMIERLSP